MPPTAPTTEHAARLVPRASRWRERGVYCTAGLLHGALTALAFPPVDWWPLALLAPMPLVWAARRSARPRTIGSVSVRAGLWAAAGVLPLWVFEERWLIDVAGLWYILLAVNLALYSWLFVAITGRSLRRIGPTHILWLAPVIWTGIEALRGEFIWGGYAWYLAGQPLIASPRLAAPGSIGGQYLVSMLAVGTGTTLLLALRPGTPDGPSNPQRTRGRALAALGLVVVAWAGLSWWSSLHTTVPVGVVRIAAVQTNVRQDNKERWTPEATLRDFADFLAMTEAAAKHEPRPNLIVWPETMFPGAALNAEAVEAQRKAGLVYRIDPAAVPESLRPMLEQSAAPGLLPATFFADALCAVQKRLGIPMLVGAATADGLDITVNADGRVRQKSTAHFNSALVIAHGAVQDRYDKMELMAFGEVVPYVWRFPALAKAIVDLGVEGWTMDLGWGKRSDPLTIPLPAGGAHTRDVARFATPICFEATMSRVASALTGDGTADAFINITNDGWFGPHTGCREAHLLAARWRCVEFGLPMVRAANTGISCLVDAQGRIAGALSPHTQDVLHVAVPLQADRAPTVFSRIGNVPGFAALTATTCLVLWLVIGALHRPRSAGRIA